jgi:Phage-related minor tail protein
VANEIGTAFVGVQLDAAGMQQQLGGLGPKLSGGLAGVASGIAAALGPAGIIGAAVAGTALVVGKALYGIGAQFDDMSDTIAVSSGASGDELEGLEDVAKSVAKTVPQSFEDVGTAVGELSARTGLAGKDLEDMSAQVLELSRLTGEDLNRTIETSTRLLGDWGLEGEAASKGLDTLFVASQETGVEVNRLAELMTKFGGPFRQMGLGFEESAALLGKWEKEGVNTELVAGSMRIALGKLAKAGREPGPAFRETIEEIQALGPGADATRKAIELFGARAGPDMAAAILEGRFAVDDLLASMDKSKSTIRGAAADTNDFAEEWRVFKNQVLVAIEPLATAVFTGMADGMKLVNRYSPQVLALFEDLGPAMEDVAYIAKTLRPVFEVAIQPTLLMLRNLVAAIRLVFEVLAATVALIAALLRGDWAGAWKAAERIVQAFVDYGKAVLGNYVKYLLGVTAPFRKAGEAIGEAIRDGVLGIVRGLGNATAGLIRGATGAVSGAARALGAAVVSGFRSGVAALQGLVSGAMGRLRGAVSGAVSGVASAASQIGAAIVRGVLAGVTSLPGQLKAKLEGMIGGVLGSLDIPGRSPVDEAAEETIGQPIVRGAVAGVVKGSSELSSAVAETVRKAVDAGRASIEAARSTFDASFGRLTGDLLGAFDAIAGQAKTKAERELERLEAQRAAADLADRRAAAEAQYAEAVAGGDPAAIAAAEKQRAAIVYEVRRAALEKEAAQQRLELDARNARRRRSFEDELAELQAHLARTGATENEARKRVTALAKRFGVTYSKLGGALGEGFSKMLRDSIEQTADDVERILERIRKAIAKVQAASAAVKPPSSGGRAVAPAPAGLTAAPYASGAGGGLAGPVSPGSRLRRALAGVELEAAAEPELEVRVYIGDTELRGIVRTEVVRGNTGLARTLLAGART